MANFKQLHDLYRFPGFVPRPHIRGIFGEPMAVVISLKRCRKKLSAASAAKLTSATTTNGRAKVPVHDMTFTYGLRIW